MQERFDVHSLPNRTPKRFSFLLVRGRNSGIGSPSPKPSVDIDGLQVFGIATFALEVALATGGIDGADVIWREEQKKRNADHEKERRRGASLVVVVAVAVEVVIKAKRRKEATHIFQP